MTSKRGDGSRNGQFKVPGVPATEKRGGYSGSAPKVEPKPPKGPAATVPAKKK